MLLKSFGITLLGCFLILFSSCSNKTNQNTTKHETKTVQNPQFLTDSTGLWKDIDPKAVAAQTTVQLPQRYRYVILDFEGLKKKLLLAPHVKNKDTTSGVLINIPLPEGTFEIFAVYETEIMAPELAAKFPDIKTYAGNGIKEKTSNIRLDFNPNGFHAMLITLNGTVIIDPSSRNDNKRYLCYYKQDMGKDTRPPFETDTLK